MANPIYRAERNEVRRQSWPYYYEKLKRERPEVYARARAYQKDWWAKNGKAVDARRKGKVRRGAVTERARAAPESWRPFVVPDYLKTKR